MSDEGSEVFLPGNFQAMAGVASIAAPNGWLYARYYTGGPQNWVKFGSAEMDKLIDQQAVLVKDPEGRKKILQDIQRKIIDAAVYIPIILYHGPTAMRREVKDCFPPLGVSSHNTFWVDTWLDT